MLRAFLASMLLVAASLFTGCAAQGTVEGIFQQQDFKITDFAPKAHINHGAEVAVVTLSESSFDGQREILRLVNITLSETNTLHSGDVIEVGEDLDAELGVSTGDLVRMELENGSTLISSENNDFAHAVQGTVTIDESSDDVLAGSFSVELNDGGHLQGSFVIDHR